LKVAKLSEFRHSIHQFREFCNWLHRIVSLSKPHVRPIVRGKASAPVEFEAKVSASVIDGYFFVDRVSWDAYNECGDLPSGIGSERERIRRGFRRTRTIGQGRIVRGARSGGYQCC
jgi:hypothetical protein